jgi:hypothetical protein
MAGVLTSNRGKIGLAAGCLLVAAVVYFSFGGRRGIISSDINFVDVTTGKMYSIDRYKIKLIPAPNPSTGERTLFPCYKGPSGLQVDGRYRESLEELGDRNHYVDPETLAIRSAD